eukprot:4044270-Prymnesium_polylepis.1
MPARPHGRDTHITDKRQGKGGPSASPSPARRRSHAATAGSTVGHSASERRNSRRIAHTMKQL